VKQSSRLNHTPSLVRLAEAAAAALGSSGSLNQIRLLHQIEIEFSAPAPSCVESGTVRLNIRRKLHNSGGEVRVTSSNHSCKRHRRNLKNTPITSLRLPNPAAITSMAPAKRKRNVSKKSTSPPLQQSAKRAKLEASLIGRTIPHTLSKQPVKRADVSKPLASNPAERSSAHLPTYPSQHGSGLQSHAPAKDSPYNLTCKPRLATCTLETSAKVSPSRDGRSPNPTVYHAQPLGDEHFAQSSAQRNKMGSLLTLEKGSVQDVRESSAIPHHSQPQRRADPLLSSERSFPPSGMGDVHSSSHLGLRKGGVVQSANGDFPSSAD